MLSARYWAREFRPTISNKTCPSNERLISHSFCSSLQSRRFCTESLRYIDRCIHLEKQKNKTNGGGAGKGVGEGRTKEKCLPAKPRRERDRSEGAANDLGSLRIGLTTSLCAGNRQNFWHEWFVRRRAFCSNLQSVIFLLKASESQFQSHIAAKSRNKFLRKHLVGIKKRERFTFSWISSLRQELLS